MLRSCPIEEDTEGNEKRGAFRAKFLRQKQKTSLIFHDKHLQNIYKVQSMCDVPMSKAKVEICLFGC